MRSIYWKTWECGFIIPAQEEFVRNLLYQGHGTIKGIRLQLNWNKNTMQIKDLIYKVSLVSVSGRTDVDIRSVCFDSRKAEPEGCLFVAVRGTNSDGHEYISQVVSKGVVAVICEELPEEEYKGCTIIQVKD